MKLNIHLTSHPIIQNLSNLSNKSNVKQTTTSPLSKYLGLLLMYETLRKWIKTYHLRIKHIDSEKELIIIDPKESYTIIFNEIDCLSVFQEIALILPKVNLELIKNNEIETDYLEKRESILNSINLYTKIIIVNYNMNIKYIEVLIQFLIKTKKMPFHQIFLTCVKCTTTQLIQLSEDKLCKNLNVYTAQIIE